MSLLNQASSWTSNGPQKRKPRMRETYQNIQNTPNPDSLEKKENPKEMENDDRTQRVQNLIDKMNTPTDETGLANFNPPKQEMPKIDDLLPKRQSPMKTEEEEELNITMKEGFSSMYTPEPKRNGSSYQESYKPTMAYYKQPDARQTNAPSYANKDLIEKLNYMIRLLEEQQKEPTQNIFEEYILYCLLGVFMIYLVDSFTKAGKYVR